MKSFRKLLGLGDPLLRQADTLVSAAETYATERFTSLLKKFSFLREVDKRHWVRVSDRDDPITDLIAKSIVNVTATGERDQKQVMERALNALGVKSARRERRCPSRVK
jgi:hypothetical protein